MNTSPLRLTILALSGLSFAFSVSILGTAAHTLHVYKTQHTTNPWWLPLWTEHFDTHGTSGLIGAATVALVLNAAYLAVQFIPKLNLANRPHLRLLIALATTIPSALVTLGTVVFAHILNRQSPDIDTIQTWTCRYGENPPASADFQLPKDQSNDQFSALCVESKFAIWTTLVVFLLQFFLIGFSIVAWGLDLWNSRKEKKQNNSQDGWKDGSSMEMR